MNGLGNKKTSELMDEMLVLADNHQNGPLFEHFFLEQLPEDIWLQLANDDFMDARKITLKTDVLGRLNQQANQCLLARLCNHCK